MPVTTFEGPMGSGKSLTATALAYTEHTQNGRKVIANYKLNFPYTHLDPVFFVENIQGEELTNAVVVLDEAVFFLESRTSGSKLVRLFSTFVVQARHRDLELYICTQHIDMVEKRTRRAPEVRGTCSMVNEIPCRQCRCTNCRGTGRINGGPDCPQCGGKGATGLEPRGKDGVCLECHGLGFMPQYAEESVVCHVCGGEGHGIGCTRCLGHGETGWATTSFYDFKRNRHRSIRVFGPAFWGLYNTKEQFLPTGRARKIPVEDLS